MRTRRRGDTEGVQGLGKGVIVGCAVTVLVYGLAELSHLGHAVAIALTAGAAAVLVAYLGPWARLGRWMRGLFGRGVHDALMEGEQSALAEECEGAAQKLDALLAADVQALWGKQTCLRELRENKRRINAYHREHRPAAQGAVELARLTITVPPNILRFAEDPKYVGELQYLRDWLHGIAEAERLTSAQPTVRRTRARSSAISPAADSVGNARRR